MSAAKRPSDDEKPDPRDPEGDALLLECGRYLRHVRDKVKGLTQYDVAAMVGISQVRVSRAEIGKGSVGTQVRIARALGMEFWELAKGAREFAVATADKEPDNDERAA